MAKIPRKITETEIVVIVGPTCTGKTSLGESRYGKAAVIEGDDVVLKDLGSDDDRCKYFREAYGGGSNSVVAAACQKFIARVREKIATGRNVLVASLAGPEVIAELLRGMPQITGVKVVMCKPPPDEYRRRMLARIAVDIDRDFGTMGVWALYGNHPTNEFKSTDEKFAKYFEKKLADMTWRGKIFQEWCMENGAEYEEVV